jgi:hypothetical protein
MAVEGTVANSLQDLRRQCGKTTNRTLFVRDHSGVIGMKRRIAAALTGIVLTVSVSSCSVEEAVQQAAAVINSAMNDIAAESADWQYTLEHITDGVTKDVKELINVDAARLLGQLQQGVTSTIGCATDILASKAIEGLAKIKARLLNETYYPPPPSFCSFRPNTIDLALADRRSVLIQGYDLDSTAPIRVTHVLKEGSETDVKIYSASSKYEGTLAIENVQFGPQSDFIRIYGANGMLHQIKVLQPVPRACEVNTPDNKSIGPVTVFPTLTNPETMDSEFFGHGPLIHVGFSVTNKVTHVEAVVAMDAAEEIPFFDRYIPGNTYAEGRLVVRIYTPPPGFQVSSIDPPDGWEGHTVRDTGSGTDRVNGDGSTLLDYWEIVGDVNGPDIGVPKGTSATAYFKPLKAYLAEIPGHNGCR